jgi:hypothetical protein
VVREENNIEVGCLIENNDMPAKYQEGLFTAISVGFGLLLLGALFITTPNLFDKVIAFFKDIGVFEVPNTNMLFLAPESTNIHSVVYQAAEQFSIALTVFHVIILALRFIIPSPLSKKSESVSSLVYWAGASLLIQSFLIENAPITRTNWFEFWSLIIVLAGISILARAAFMAVARIQQ